MVIKVGLNELDQAEGNPWHDHNPAFLSGVYYLHVPGRWNKRENLVFYDPRKPQHKERE